MEEEEGWGRKERRTFEEVREKKGGGRQGKGGKQWHQ